jgi:dihydropyrimidine dehydrogenase (NAD+) subunit PreA
MLEIEYAGLKLKNPVIVASATPTFNFDNWKRCEEAGAGAFVPKSVISSKKLMEGQKFTPGQRTGFSPRPRFKLINKDDASFDSKLAKKGAFFYMLTAGEHYPTPNEFVGWMEKAKKEISIPIIASICGGEKQYEEWAQLAKIVESAGADAVELNMHHMPVNNYTDPEVLKAVKESVKIPVIGKTMAPWENAAEVAKKLEAMGADAITTLGHIRLRGLEIDPEEEKICLQPIIHGISGSVFAPIGLALVAQTAMTVKIPVSGVTGVMSWRGVVKNILAGATTVQVCTVLYQDGYKAITNMIKGLEGFMKQKGYKNTNDFRGKILKDITSPIGIPDEPPIKAFVDKEECTGCGSCREVCFYSAIEMERKKAGIDVEKCDGCGLCVSICPVQAIAMQNVTP